MQTYDLALVGFGGVSRALAQLVAEDRQRFTQLGFGLRVVAITDLLMGSLVQPDGIDLARVLAMPRGSTFAGAPGGSATPENEAVIRGCAADIVVEATFTDPREGEPASSHVRWALESGKHVVTTNKGPVALQGAALHALATARGLRFAHEGSVLSGTPVFNLIRGPLAGVHVTGFQGVLNGTCNYVLGRMETGLSMAQAVAEAQQMGYAEADPSADLQGSDVQLKVAILANELLGAHVLPAQVTTTGIEGISAHDITSAAARGERWKLIGSAHLQADGSVHAQVTPRALSGIHPLAAVSGATNALSLTTDLLGEVTITGPGAGRTQTAYALIADIISIHAGTPAGTHGSIPAEDPSVNPAGLGADV
ncbi:homoserine dehydrogenase [Streptomyces sp. NP160]|uniref:homoserine dehydrogenase n=1 Tax=Streptomyces sp. NP160 TaxID=2586637 RepID=UPI0011190E2D|nr:homoserine dehydrogenase [Streptomyces sp. NP160]TNM61943.1 homoserine dehydrogenase [Streptomyces sp. NP160]